MMQNLVDMLLPSHRQACLYPTRSPVDCFLGHSIETSIRPDVILIPYYRKRSSYKGY